MLCITGNGLKAQEVVLNSITQPIKIKPAHLKKEGILMSIKIRIPTPLQSLTNNRSEVEIDSAKDIKELIEKLEEKYPGIKNRLCDENGCIRRFITFFVNEEDIRFLDGINTKLKDGDEVSIIPAIAGGEKKCISLA